MIDSVRLHAWKAEGVQVMPLQRGLLVRAGEWPTTGDINSLVTPLAYHEVAAALHPYLVPDVEFLDACVQAIPEDQNKHSPRRRAG